MFCQIFNQQGRKILKEDKNVIDFDEFKRMVDHSGVMKDDLDHLDNEFYKLRSRIGDMTAKELKEKIKSEE